MRNTTRISDLAAMTVVLGYMRARRMPMYITYTDPEWTGPYAGVSSELIGIDGEAAVIRSANGDERTVPVAHVSMDVEA